MTASHPLTFLAIGAHAGDMEVSCGAVLRKHVKHGDRVTLLHLTLGEGGNPKHSPAAYGEQKQREARAVAQAMEADVEFGPYRDGQLPVSDESRLYVADVIRRVKPTHIITHWKNSIHKDHAAAHTIVMDAVLLASLEGVQTAHERHRGVRGVYCTENWEDPGGYTPYVFVDVSDEMEEWRRWIVNYEFIRGGISAFPYLDYYTSLARVRGAVAGFHSAVTFAVDPFEQRLAVPLLG
jgi:LmbE family N-acetylglucosaminyl deacetylase